MLRPHHHILVVLALATAAASASAQSTIAGVVVENGSERSLPGVHLVLLDQRGEVRGETLSNDSGGFFLQVPEPGPFRIVGSLIGYADIRSEYLQLEPGDELTVEILMDVEAVLLEPLVVRGRVNTMGPELAGFYERMARGKRTGFGHFVSREDVDRLAPFESSDLLRRIPSVRVIAGRAGRSAGIRMASGCVPAIFVDGMQINRSPMRGVSLDDMVPAVSLEGIEVYRGATAHQGAYHDPSGCGLILVWTRRGDDSGQPWSWRRFFAGAGLFAALLLLLR